MKNAVQIISVLKARPVRGVLSDAMLCSEKELGLSDDHDGILVLDPGLALGTPIADTDIDTLIEVYSQPWPLWTWWDKALAPSQAPIPAFKE